MIIPLIVGSIVLLLIALFALKSRPRGDYINYDPDEAPLEQPQAIDDYQPWPGNQEFRDVPAIEVDVETVTALWNEAVNDGDTVLAAALFDEYERLCRTRSYRSMKDA